MRGWSLLDEMRSMRRFRFGTRDLHESDLRQSLMLLEALDRKKPYYRQSVRGYLSQEDTYADLLAALAALVPEATLLCVYAEGEEEAERPHGRMYGNDRESLYMWPEGYFDIDFTPNSRHIDFSIAAFDQDLVRKVRTKVLEYIIKRNAAQVEVVLHTSDGPESVSIGRGGIPLCRFNYGTTVLEAFDHIVADLQTDTPCGRLCVFTGPPGTGKTYLIEGIIHAVPKARYLVIPPTLITGLVEPALMSVLINKKDEALADAPTVLIVEDASDCLVPRDGANLPAIASLLNLSEGLIGRRLDIRVLATSNADYTKIDPALLRDGRLCREIQFPFLTMQEADAAFKGLLPDYAGDPIAWPPPTAGQKGAAIGFGGTTDRGCVSLGTVYKQAHLHGLKDGKEKA